MIIKVIGKDKALEDIEKARKLIKEAEQILYQIPLEIGLEMEPGTTEIVNVDRDIR